MFHIPISCIGLNIFTIVEKRSNFRYYRIIKVSGAVLNNELMQKIVVVGEHKKANEDR